MHNVVAAGVAEGEYLAIELHRVGAARMEPVLYVLHERLQDPVPSILSRSEKPCQILVPVAADRLAVQLQTAANGAERQAGVSQLVDLRVASSNPL
ncbi:hypothetical protein GCM10010331_69460 [Streptomyces xanthochromogenes]|nr:hypothetical protein [Streptomyces xanthochromogenes]GHB71635.1 hypothetical protein GCM10010331_69460 [Streptomyces xanthochromogenes]